MEGIEWSLESALAFEPMAAPSKVVRVGPPDRIKPDPAAGPIRASGLPASAGRSSTGRSPGADRAAVTPGPPPPA